jgi:cytochrome c biogenesis protein
VLWRRYRHPRTRAGSGFFDRARHRATLPASLPPGRAATVVRDRLRARQLRVLAHPGDPSALYADRFGWGGLGTVAAHVSFLVILGAFVLSAHAGIDDAVTVPVGGDPVDVGHGTGLRVSASSFAARYDDAGRPLDYVSSLRVEDAEGGIAEQEVRVNQPLRHGGVRFHQATFGIAADVRVTGPGGEVLHAGAVPLLWTSQDGTAAVGSVALLALGVDIEVFAPASGVTGGDLAAGQAAFRVVRSADAAVTAAVTAEQGEPVALGDLTAVFEREREYTGIAVRRDPGAPLMWIGSALLIGGSTVTFACRHRRVWIRVEEDARRVRLGSSDERDAPAERWFADLAHDLEAALDRAATDEEGRLRD